MSELPTGWAMAPLGLVADWGSGGTPKAGNPDYYGGTIPWAVIGDLTDGVVRSTASSITQAGLAKSSAKMVDPGAVLVAMYGSIGKLGLPDKPMATNQAIAFARPRDGVLHRKYLFYYLMQARERLAAAGKGATQQNISQTVLKAWPIPIAPFMEQGRIVSVIEEQFSRLDAGVAALERVRRNLKRMRAAVLQRTAKLPLDASWADVTVADSVRIVDYRGRTPPFAEGGVPHLRSFNVKGGRVDWNGCAYVTDETYDKYMSRGFPGPGDLLFTTEAPMGEVALAPVDQKFCMAQRMMLLKPDPEVWFPEYLMYHLRSPWFRSKLGRSATGTTVQGISSRNFRPLAVLLPPLSKQRELAETIRHELSAIDVMELSVEAQLHRSNQLRSSLLRAAFAGLLVAQEPGEEAAASPNGEKVAKPSSAVANRRLTTAGRVRSAG